MLPRAQRLVAPADHRLVARRGRRCRRGPIFVKSVRTGTLAGAQLAVVVPKPLGSAPVRNRLRRRLQHAAAPLIAQLPAGSLVVVRAEVGAETLTSQVLTESLTAALHTVCAS